MPSKKEKLPLSVTHPELAKEADGWDPTLVTSGSGQKADWRCRSEHVYSASISHRTNMRSGCPYCSGKKVLKGFNDLETKFPELSKEADGWNPSEFTFGSGKKVKWKCRCQTCKRIVTPMYTSIQGGQRGCKFCADWGIDYGARGYLYLMTNQELSSHKIGIGNTERSRGRSRIAQHERKGWKLYKQLDFDITDDAYFLEQDVLKWIREEKQLGIYLSEFEMPQGGYSETVDASEIDLPTIWAKVMQLSKVKR